MASSRVLESQIKARGVGKKMVPARGTGYRFYRSLKGGVRDQVCLTTKRPPVGRPCIKDSG